ncbi:MAG: hypothetical protein HC916_00910 [Coleofasciculaceae cyanobacterium SM2_1_6]|nr:hypothetical protein [Coleofasciculaceae cyanobacterium SM2_1_6]
MAIFKFGSKRKTVPHSPQQSAPPVTPIAPTPTSGAIQKPQGKSLSQLEAEIEAQYLPTTPHRSQKGQKQNRGFLPKLVTLALVVGVPVGVVALANLPVPGWRHQVARTAPILLFPTYSSWDRAYKSLIDNLNQAEQLIDRPTSATDLDLGGQKLTMAREAVNKLPSGFIEDDFTRSLYWYNWHYSRSGFATARSQLGTLESKLFQEQNAQTLLRTTEENVNQAKLAYQQATTSTDKQLAATRWHEGLGKMAQVSTATLAGKNAQQKLVLYRQDFAETVGLFAGNAETRNLITAARQFAWQAAKDGQNPPHEAIKWEQIMIMWQEAIDRLEKIQPADLEGYKEAQKLIVDYRASQSEVQVRLAAERSSVRSFAAAQRDITTLVASAGYGNKSYTLSQLQGIINQLESVKPGTTSYLKSQELLIFAKNKWQELRLAN